MNKALLVLEAWSNGEFRTLTRLKQRQISEALGSVLMYNSRGMEDHDNSGSGVKKLRRKLRSFANPRLRNKSFPSYLPAPLRLFSYPSC